MRAVLTCWIFALLPGTDAKAQSPVCAEVRIEIRQKVSLERQAFDAVLRIRNGLTTSIIEKVGVELIFTDESGTPITVSDNPDNVGALFFTRLDGLENTPGIDGTGSISPMQTAVARWLIIPSANSGGLLPNGRRYLIGARLSYRIGDGEPTVVDVVPEIITVRPQPRLRLDYFLAGDVYADDAVTPALESPVPFTFGVRVTNSGAGSAQHLRIESAQPSIVENEQGLLIGFEILGGYVDNHAAAPSLLLDFGDIAPGTSRMGRWQMQTTLSGRFTQIEARYSHADALGGALTSLIDGEPGTHLLLRDVLVDLPGRDSVRDYLARDEDVLRVYESSGQDTQVTDLSSAASLLPAGTSTTYTLTLPNQVGPTYAGVTDPLGGTSANVQAQRHDGTLVPAANVWFSKTRNSNLSWSHFINVFDVRDGAPYLVTVDTPEATSALQGVVYSDSNGNGMREVDEPGLPAVALALSGQAAGAGVNLGTLSQPDGSWQFDALPAGEYSVVTGNAAGHIDGVHHAGSAGGLVGSDRIGTIVLTTGQNATGYLFAKIAPDTPPSADLALNSLGAQAEAQRNATTQITLQASNIGPQAALASVAITLPESFHIEGVDSTRGLLDTDSHVWDIGALAPGDEASITLTGRYTIAGQQTISASIASQGEQSLDPQPANNTRSAGIDVTGAGELVFDIGTRATTRLLLLTTCAASPGCAAARAQRWQALLDDGVPHLVTSDPAVFAKAMRDGDWNALWIDGDSVPPAALLADIREAARRGSSLLMSGLRGAHWQRFEKIAGVTAVGSLPAASRSIVLASNEYFPVGLITAQSAATTYTAMEGHDPQGRLLASYDNAGGAIAASALDAHDRIVLFGFDPLPGLEASGHDGLIDGIAAGAAADVPDILLAGARLPLHLHVQSDEVPSVAVTAGLEFPTSFAVLDATPLPQHSAIDNVRWNITLPAPTHRLDASLDLRAPKVPALFTLTAGLDSDGHLQTHSLDVRVRDTASQMHATQEKLSQLAAPEATLEQINLLLTAAATAHKEGRVEDARNALFDVLELLDSLGGATPLALEFSRLLLLFSRVPAGMPDRIFADQFELTP